MSLPTVSVVIPSVGRDTLLEAVASVQAQTDPPLEIIVVFDLPRPPADLVLPPGVRTLLTGGGAGANGARQAGIDVAAGDAVALLDDDDYWYPDKLAEQRRVFAEIQARGGRGIIASGVDVIRHDGSLLYTVPRDYIAPGQPLADYLFRRRQLRNGGSAMSPSSLLIDRALLSEVRLDCELPVHEDWDWMLRACAHPGVELVAVPQPLIAYRLPALGARQATSGAWLESVAWADARRDQLSAREYGDFLLAVSAALAVDAGDRVGAVGVFARALRHGRPGNPALLFAAGLLLSPHQIGLRVWPLVDRATALARRLSGGGSWAS